MIDFGMLDLAAQAIAHTAIFSLTAFVLAGTVMLVCFGLYALGSALADWNKE